MTANQCPGVSRRTFLADTGWGVTGLALGSLLTPKGVARADDGLPHFSPRAKSVIWIFFCGGVSQMESFDPKPALDKYAGKTVAQTPFAEALSSDKNPLNLKFERDAEKKPILGTQTTFRRHGQSGMPVSDFFPHLATCADDLAVVRSFWTTSVLHVAQLQFHTGREPREGGLPTMGSWVSYGLGSLDENLPRYVVLGRPSDTCCGGDLTFGSGYLGPEHAGVRVHVGEKEPVPYLRPRAGAFSAEERAGQLEAIAKFNRLAQVEYPDDPALVARIKAYELAARMQTSIPETLDVEKESRETRALYGLDDKATREFGTLCLVARRMAERGVRFIQVFHGSSGFGPWDAHYGVVENHGKAAGQTDRPVAGLLKDLKRRGLGDDVLVVGATEFGRTSTTAEKGREHNPFGFSCWLAGAGIKGGTVHGATDELGYHAVEQRHYVTDLHATTMHLLGLDSRKLQIPGRRRIDMDHGRPIREILV